MKRTFAFALTLLLLAAGSCSDTVNTPDGSETTGSSGAPSETSAAGTLRYCPPGDLVGSGEAGNTSRKVFFPDLHFPIEFAAATHMVTGNSQMYNPGGYCSNGVCNGSGGGSSCVLSNFKPPWRDTFCEKAGRTYGTDLCPDGLGHQGLDIRPPIQTMGETQVCRRDHWFALAVTDGEVTRARGAVVEFVDRGGRRYVYRHMNPSSIRALGISRGDNIERGQRVGRLDQYNNSGTKRYTTLHLHLEGLAVSSTGETLYYPLYTSIIAAYREAAGLPKLVSGNFNLRVDGQREITGGCG